MRHEQEFAWHLLEDKTSFARILLDALQGLLHLALYRLDDAVLLRLVSAAFKRLGHRQAQIVDQLEHVLLENASLAGWQRDRLGAVWVRKMMDVAPVLRDSLLRRHMGNQGLDIGALAGAGRPDDEQVVPLGRHIQAELHGAHSPVLPDDAFQRRYIQRCLAEAELLLTGARAVQLLWRYPKRFMCAHDPASNLTSRFQAPAGSGRPSRGLHASIHESCTSCLHSFILAQNSISVR